MVDYGDERKRDCNVIIIIWSGWFIHNVYHIWSPVGASIARSAGANSQSGLL